MWAAGDWTDYELLDAGSGEKLERWGGYILRRPDPQALWPVEKNRQWESADAVYHRSGSGGGSWEFISKLPVTWEIAYRRLRLTVKPMQFKHTGIFPEQAVNWDWVTEKITKSNKRPDEIRILSLFAYTGAVSVAAASAGAQVCHVDAARGVVAIAKENAALSRIPPDRIRYIVDDAMKFIKRELRRGSVYDAIIMDPPAYGRGPGGELWKAETHLFGMVDQCAGLLAESPLFFLVNSYASGISAASLDNVLRIAIGRKYGGRVECGELGLPAASGGFILPCGCCARWERE